MHYRLRTLPVLWMHPMFVCRPAMLMAVAAWLGTASCLVQADDTSFDHGNAIKSIAAALQKSHYTHKKLDDDLSAEWFAAFIANVDPRRMYFLQSDISELRHFVSLLDDHVKSGDFEFPKLVRSRYRERVASAASNASLLIDAGHDFTADESLPRRFDAYAKTAEELRERWRLRIKGELLIEKVHGCPLAEVRSHLHGRYERIAKQARELTDAQLCKIYLDSLVKLYDPHSVYFGNLASFRGPSYSLGLSLRAKAGRYVIDGIHPGLRSDDTLPLIGWELMAIKRKSGIVLDLVETLPHENAIEIIRSPLGPLESDTRVVLELLHPVTLKRISVEWDRVRYP